MSTGNRIALAGIMLALALGLGYLLSPIPNIELMSLTLFAAGYFLGIPLGALIGMLAFFLYSVLNPYGIAPPILLMSQVIGGAIIGVGGGITKLFWKRLPPAVGVIVAATAGASLTLLYDILTNIGGFIAYTSKTTIWAYLLGGIIFAITHIASNTAIFAVLFPIVARVGKRNIRF